MPKPLIEVFSDAGLLDQPKKRGPVPQGRTARLMLYLSPEEKAQLLAYCAREGCTQAEAARRALKRLK